MALPGPDHWTSALWSYLSDAAAECGQPLRLRIHWPGKKELFVDVEIAGGQPRAMVDEELLARLNGIDQKELEDRLGAEEFKAWQRTEARLRSLSGKTASLNTAAIGALVPLGSSVRTTRTLNVYQQLDVGRDSLQPLLSAEDWGKVDALGEDPSLHQLAEVLGLLAKEEEPPAPGGEPAPASALSSVPTPPAIVAEPAVEAEEHEKSIWEQHHNVIFFGPPGTGKSHQVDELARTHLRAKDENIFRVTFHPEYTYFDFAGQYRPAVGWLDSQSRFRKKAHDTTTMTVEPRVYYVFEPGPLSSALQTAAKLPPRESVVLIIEEINRGNCAAIFGDVFQLLDRRIDETAADFGISQYNIRPSREWAAWLDETLGSDTAAWKNGQLRLPSNLFIYATMNTSDQSLFPMDTAFRRRWGMQYVGVTPTSTLATKVPVRPTEFVHWRLLMEPLNAAIVEHTGTDDKQMGPYFIKAASKDKQVADLEFESKVLFYLWADVFRDRPERVFVSEIRTYDQLLRYYRAGKDVFRKEIYESTRRTDSRATPPPAAPSPTDGA